MGKQDSEQREKQFKGSEKHYVCTLRRGVAETDCTEDTGGAMERTMRVLVLMLRQEPVEKRKDTVIFLGFCF